MRARPPLPARPRAASGDGLVWASALLVGLAALAAAGPAPVAAGPAWGSGRASVAPGGGPEARRIVAVGDVHGDLGSLEALLRRLGLVDPAGRWSGGDAVLVQTGDITDRGPDVRGVMDLLIRLQEEARSDGGRVVVLLGNHEAMNLVGDWRYVGAEALEDFVVEAQRERRLDAFDAWLRVRVRRRDESLDELTREETRRRRKAWMEAHPPGFLEYVDALRPDGEYGRWLRTLPGAVRLGRTVFVHGGLDPEGELVDLEEIDRRIHAEVAAVDRVRAALEERDLVLAFEPLQAVVRVAVREIERIRERAQRRRLPSDRWQTPYYRKLRDLAGMSDWTTLSPRGPLWFRGYARWSDEVGDERIGAVLDEYGADRIVVGHTPRADGEIQPRFGGRVVLIDTGMLGGDYYPGGRASALEIVGDCMAAVYLDGREVLAGEGCRPEAGTGAAGPGRPG